MHRTTRHRGFSLVETLVVVTIVGILAGIGTATYLRNATNAREASVRDTLHTIDQQARGLAGDDSPWPHLTEAAAGVELPPHETAPPQNWGVQTVDETAGYVTFERYDICGVLRAEADGKPGEVELYDCTGTPPTNPPPAACVPPDTPGYAAPDVTVHPDGSATIDWTEPAGTGDGITGYQLTIDDGSGDTRTLDVTSPPPSSPDVVITELTVTGLTAGSTYTVDLASYGPAGPDDCASSTATTTFTATVDPPTTDRPALTAEGRDEAIQLDWDVVDTSTVDYYELRRTVTPNPAPDMPGDWDTFPLTPAGTPTDTTLLDPGLTNGTRYHYQVRAIDTDGTVGGWSNIAAAVPTDTIAPGDGDTSTLTATAGERQVDLTWTALTDTSTYRIFRRDVSSTDPLTELTTVPGAVTSYTDTAVTPNVTYEYKVTGVDEAGNESGQSNPDTATPYDTTPPVCPTGFTATPVDHNDSDGQLDDMRIDFTWTGPDPDPVTFTLYLTPTTSQTFGENATTSYTRYFDDLPQDVYDQISVDVSDPYGNVSTCPLGTVAYIDWVPPTAPTLTVDDNRHQEILITWTQSTDNVSGVDDYVLQGRAPAGSWATLTTVPAGNPRTFTHTGPAWNQTWDYRIIVSDNAGNTTTSATDTGTFADLVPPEDDGLTLTAIDSGFRIDLVFATLEDDGTSEYSGVDDHAYRWRHNSTGTFSSGGWNSWTTTGSTTINATSGIVYDDYYEVQIRVRDNAGNANYTSSIVHANVDTTPPSITVTQPALDEQENGILNLAAVATDSYAGIDSTGVQFSYRCALCQDGLGWNAYRSIANDPTPNASDVFAHNMRIAAPDDDWGVKDGHIRYRDYPTFYIPNTYADIRGSVCDAAGNCASDVGGDFYTANTAGSRIGGANRDETSALISSTLFPNGAPIAFIARSDVAADALAAAPVAAQMGGPVLLTDGGDGLLDPGSLNSSVANELSRLEGLNPGMRVAMVGGPTALKNSIRDEVESICNCNLVDYTDGDIDTPGGPFGSIPTNPRFNGQNRYYTNAMLAQMAWETGAYAIAANRAGVLVNGEWDQHKLLAGVLAAQGEFGMYFLTRCDGDSDQCPAPQAGDGSGRYNDPTRHGMPWVVHNWIDSTLWGSFFTDGYVLGNTNFVNAATQTLFETWVSSVSTRYPANEANLPSVAANSVSRELFSYSSVEAPGTPNERVTTVYLTRDDNFADALAGAPGIVADNATLLVTDNGTVSTPTCERLKEIAPRRVIALGGQLAISDSALNAAVDDARNWNNPSHTC